MLKRISADLNRHARKVDPPGQKALMFYYRLDDGRMAPIESGGLVELALTELGARLVDVSVAETPYPIFGLN